MQFTALCLLLLLNLLDCGSARVSLTASPRTLQFFKHDAFSLSCEEEEQEGEEADGWTVMKKMQDGEVIKCTSPCSITAAFPATDSGVYWCEAGLEATSKTVNITVTAGHVILQSPALPVMEGDNVTLCCRHRLSTYACDGTADFYKDGLLFGTSSMGIMIIHDVSKYSEGLYKCNISGYGESPGSWLGVRAPHPTTPDPPPSLLSASSFLRHLIVGTPYLLSTILLGLIYRDKKRVSRKKSADYVNMQIIT
ncbi:high affinity immunoglobulin gamma Fc receptor I-like [Channa argus]|uniref:high affinity immunoglobulin gamma Fc receptor I-like n=1 Tax=Channa argus TaxID=215402 RepID=UPI00352190C2